MLIRLNKFVQSNDDFLLAIVDLVLGCTNGWCKPVISQQTQTHTKKYEQKNVRSISISPYILYLVGDSKTRAHV